MKNHSASNFGKDEGLIHEAVVTGRKVGADEKFWERLAHDKEFFLQVVDVVKGFNEINPIEHTIYCDIDPSCDSHFRIEKHKKMGEFEVERKSGELYVHKRKLELYLSESQENNKLITGDELRKELQVQDQVALNANVLDWFLDNEHMIPENFKDRGDNGVIRHIYFWGTIYRHCKKGTFYVRCLCWKSEQWKSYYKIVGNNMNNQDPSLILCYFRTLD